jgi:hypothetical protein
MSYISQDDGALTSSPLDAYASDGASNTPVGGEDDQIMASLDVGISLADIPQVVAMEQGHIPPRYGATPYISKLSSLELALVKHAAASILSRSPLKEHFDLEEILGPIKVKKEKQRWGILLKLANDDKIKKKGIYQTFTLVKECVLTSLFCTGVFGVPLEVLVERKGCDSLLGATAATLRIPSLVDDIISMMRQEGTYQLSNVYFVLRLPQICPLKGYSVRVEISEGLTT